MRGGEKRGGVEKYKLSMLFCVESLKAVFRWLTQIEEQNYKINLGAKTIESLKTTLRHTLQSESHCVFQK